MRPEQKMPKPAPDACFNVRSGPVPFDDDFVHLQAAATDPQGSYTGVPQDPYEKPVQDADDL